MKMKAARSVMGEAAAAAFVLVCLTVSDARADRQLPSLKITVDGYYWARGIYLYNLANLKDSILPGTTGRLREPIKETGYFTHHLRLEPQVTFGRWVKAFARIDGLQNVVWGDNDANAQSPLFAANPSETDWLGQRVPSIKLSTLYMEVNVKLGLLRVGRMPSHWGMGLLSNGGGDLTKTRAGVDDSFGDNHFPSIYDRLLFITDLVKVGRTLAKKTRPSLHSFYFGYAYDRLVEEPFWPEAQVDFQRPYGEQTFLSRQRNNVDEHVGILMYRWYRFMDGWKPLNRFGRSNFAAGLYFVYRRQRPTDGIIRVWDETAMGYQAIDCETGDNPICGSRSNIFIIDPYLNIHLGRLISLEAEAYIIRGNTEPRAIPIGDQVDKAAIYGWAVRTRTSPIRRIPLALELEGGQASGDSTFSDASYRQRPMHPDHNVGLIMYEEFLRERSATSLAYAFPYRGDPGRVWAARGLQSQGGVINSFYFMPTVSASVYHFLKVRLAVLNAWAHKQDGALFQTGRGRHIGTEVDLGLDLSWGLGEDRQTHMILRVEGGYMVFGSQVAPDYQGAGIFSIQARLAFVL